MVATEPLDDATWDQIGNKSRFTFAENSHMVNYAQRTRDNRIAIGGRGATYPFGSKLSDAKESTRRVHETIRALLKSWFPILSDVKFTHAWGGAVAITRDWEPYVQWNPETGLGRLGGYAGDGVTMSHLAAKILAYEILDAPTELRNLHFVNQKIRNWEPEPIRYVGVNTLVKLSGMADTEERITGRASLLNRVIEPLILR
jgi:glycine/D-amino acid oxidase-like deaminating enzyme